MRCDKNYMLLYAVTDRSWCGEKGLYEQVEEALKGGITCLQLREKDLSDEDFLAEALEIKELCHRYHVPFFINDNVEVAIKCGADGIHVGQDDMKVEKVRQLVGDQMIIGVSAHNLSEAKAAEKGGADCLGVGAMFSTDTKKDAKPVSMGVLQDICQEVHIPVVAIGGLNRDNILKLKGSGADGVALVSAIFAEQDIEMACRELKKISLEMVQS